MDPEEWHCPPDLIDGSEEHEVDHIVGHRKDKRGVMQFLIRWKGEGPDGDTWLTASALKNAKETLQEYKKLKRLP
jgi:hypothetical protein